MEQMVFSFTILAAALITFSSDTVITLGSVERDLTGDGKPEVLRLVGRGLSLDSLEVTFSIESSGHLVFEERLAPLTRTSGYDAGRRYLTSAEHRAKITEFGAWFFASDKFANPNVFIGRWRGAAPGRLAQIPEVIARDRQRQLVVDSLIGIGSSRVDADRVAYRLRRPVTTPDSQRAARIWDEIRNAGVTLFEFSRGGDAITAIAWSARDRRFYRLLECC